MSGALAIASLAAGLALLSTAGSVVADGPTGKDNGPPIGDHAIVALGKAFDVGGRE